MSCLFCKIANGEIPSEKIYEDDFVYAFYDVDCKAPIHFLVITKKHISGIDQISNDDINLMGHVLFTIKEIARKLNIVSGYRIVNNLGEDGGQSVNHIHFHVLAGRKLSWPPG